MVRRATPRSTALPAVITGGLAQGLMADHPGIESRIGGAAAKQQTARSSILSALRLEHIGIYWVRAVRFGSDGLPLIVMVTIPVALFGSILGQWAPGTARWAPGVDRSTPSLTGFASRSGIVVKNAILLLTF